MKKKKNMIIAIILIIVILIIVLSKTVFSSKEKVKIYNNNESFKQNQEKDGFTFEKISCYYDGKESQINYVISNHTDKNVNLKNYELLVKDKDDKVISNIFIGSVISLAPNEEKKIENKVIGRDLSNAYKLELNTNVNNAEKNNIIIIKITK